jgi:hypothetical protein
MFEKSTSDPPMMQSWMVDAPLDSKEAALPFPVVVADPVTTRQVPVVGGLLAGLRPARAKASGSRRTERIRKALDT